MKNRLQLDWTLSTSIERSNFLEEYIQSDTFKEKPPTQKELETMSNYVLWGQDPDGLNPDQRKEIQIPRRNSTWTSKPLESLDELLESPTFSENSVYKLGAAAPKKSQKPLSREDLRAALSPSDLEHFEVLWRQIDQTELTLNFFEVKEGKRKKPPRKELLTAFTPEEITSIQSHAENLTQFHYLKLKHLLVELRREQYTLKDFAAATVQPHTSILPQREEITQDFDAEIIVLPLGLLSADNPIWRDFPVLIPANFTEEELQQASLLYWEKQSQSERTMRARLMDGNQFYFDFRDLEMVYQFLLGLEELEELEDTLFSTTSELCATLRYYMRQATFSPIHQEILALKIKRVKNQDIAAAINAEFNKNYTTNYISTIFRQKIIPAINTAAIYHEKIIGSIFFEEEFKTCSRCGRTMLRDPINFVRRTRSKDGFSNHCKQCDKEQRELKKMENK